MKVEREYLGLYFEADLSLWLSFGEWTEGREAESRRPVRTERQKGPHQSMVDRHRNKVTEYTTGKMRRTIEAHHSRWSVASQERSDFS